jgi:hypothetical protein
MHVILKKIIRHLVMLSVFFLPQEKKIAIERWLRGREEFRKLNNSDCVIVSFGKSGRTWLRVMISRFFQVKYGLSEKSLMGFDNLHRKNAEIPKIFFTHDNYIKDYTKNVDSKADFYNRKVVLLVRDPRDVAVSQFFQWKHRMRSGKKALNKYPAHGADVGVFDFVMDRDAGLPKIIDFMNLWQREAAKIGQLLIVRYEDMRTNPHHVLERILEFMGTPGTEVQIDQAVEFASYDNMKKLEEKKVFWLSGGRMVPGDRSNPDSYKVRRAKVGGYRDYFEDDQVLAIDELVDTALEPSFGYGKSPVTDRPAAANA